MNPTTKFFIWLGIGLVALGLIAWLVNRWIHLREARKLLALYRDTEKWCDPKIKCIHMDENPHHVWGNLVYNLNFGGDLKTDRLTTYGRAKYIGSSVKELLELDKKRKKWKAQRALHNFSEMTDHDFCMDDLHWFFSDLKEANCLLEDLGTTANDILKFICKTTNCLDKVFVAYLYLEQIGIDVGRLRSTHMEEGWTRVITVGWGNKMHTNVQAHLRPL